MAEKNTCSVCVCVCVCVCTDQLGCLSDHSQKLVLNVKSRETEEEWVGKGRVEERSTAMPPHCLLY